MAVRFGMIYLKMALGKRGSREDIVRWRLRSLMQKERIQQVVGALPDEVDIDALVEKLYLLEKIDCAEKQLANGEGISHEDASKRLKRWLE